VMWEWQSGKGTCLSVSVPVAFRDARKSRNPQKGGDLLLGLFFRNALQLSATNIVASSPG